MKTISLVAYTTNFLMQKQKFINKKGVGFHANRTGRLMAKHLTNIFLDEGVALNGDQMPILLHLWYKDGQNQQEIADTVFRDKATVARNIQYLERENLVLRIPDEKDKRNKKIYLTHKGKELESKVMPMASQLKEKALEGIDPKDIDICNKVLEMIYNNLNK